MKYMLIFDVGKTHIKLHLLNDKLESVFNRGIDNRVLDNGNYPHFDIDGIWQWLLSGVKDAAGQYPISALAVTTHGATAALVNRHEAGTGLVLPVLDYEYTGIESCNATYNDLRSDYSVTYSPNLPAGQNLGRQLYWQQQTFPEKFSEATDILLYPQYWAWRLTGALCSEVTSLGCHTDLWAPLTAEFSSLVTELGWTEKFPAVVPAWTSLGPVTPEVMAETGLAPDCQVFAGIHDSNASFLRYRVSCGDNPFTVVSTGTWSIVMASGTAKEGLEEKRDMLINVDAIGQPVACARFMGGREYASICSLTGARLNQPYGEPELQEVVDSGVLALPDFSGGSGPFPGTDGRVLGAVPENCGVALASLYCALMLDYQLDMVSSTGDIYIEGAFLKNPLLCKALAQLRYPQKVWMSADDTGTVQGCAYLANWGGKQPNLALEACEPTQLNKLGDYKNSWRQAAESRRQ
ncbi:MAG: hypothetical protein GYB33_00650 [Gammaproteobacteria bacterium]|nr:hypothetical protein [Gammaproteobacteria bacterium]